MTLRILQIITRIDRLPGHQPLYRVELGCGHWRTVAPCALEHEQHQVGKAALCRECGEEKDGQSR
jgi:hypothetical protein